jgi:hypothetical protein
MDMDADLAREWIAAARSLQQTMAQFRATAGNERRSAPPASAAATNTGHIVMRQESSRVPWLLHIAVTSAILCAVLSIITLLGGGMLYLNMKDHLDAIYMMAPQLKPTESIAHEHHYSDTQAVQPGARIGQPDRSIQQPDDRAAAGIAVSAPAGP